MDCSLCGNALSGFVAGIGSLIAFVVLSVAEMILVLFNLAIDKIITKKNN